MPFRPFESAWTLAIGAALALPACAAPSVTRAVPEFGLRAAFPKDAVLCDAKAGGPAHGWYMPLDGACATAGRGVTVAADYNAAFVRSGRAASYCSRAASPAATAGEAPQRLPRVASFGCRIDFADGSVIVQVVAQGGRWPAEAARSSPDWTSPRINYEVRVQTDQAHLDADLAVFAKMLAGVQVRPPPPPR